MKRGLLKTIGGCAVMLLLALSTTVSGQITYTIGDSAGFNTSTTYPTPFGDWYKTHRQQYLFLASELSAAGMGAGDITTLTWWVINDPLNIPGVTEGFTIKLKNTGTTDLGTAWDADATVVYGPVDNTPTMGAWNSFELDAPFYWDGESNILLEVCGGLSAGTYTDNGQVGYATLAFNASRTYRSDTYAFDVCAYPDAATTGTNPTRRPITRFTAAAAEACSAIPEAGAAGSTAEMVCADDMFTVSVGIVLGSGISYQWESSTDGESWGPIDGATSADYTTTQSEATWYRCVITCEGFGSDASDPVWVGQNDAADCYCEPVFTSIFSGDYISYVGIGDIANSTGEDDDNYADYTGMYSTDLAIGTEYTINVDCGPSWDQAIKTYIDFNQDGAFDEVTEAVGCVLVDAGTGGSSYAFTVPEDAMLGPTRMRVIAEWNGPCDGITACILTAFGEGEDYTVNITGEGACALVPPTDLYVDAITSSSATVNYSPATMADGTRGVLYNLSTGQLRKFTAAADASSYTFDGYLTSSTTYGVRLKTVCLAAGLLSEYSAWYYFTTSPLRTGEFVKEVSIYPNPNNGNFRIQINGYAETETEVQIMNVFGQLVYSNALSIGSNAEVLDVAINLASGTYFVKVTTGADVTSETIIIE